MSAAIDKLQAAKQHAMAIRPNVGGFPYLAEVLRKAGVSRNIWHLPSCQSIYLTELGAVVEQGQPLLIGTVDVAPFDESALIAALRSDQAGESSFPEFLQSTWNAGVVSYDVDLIGRTCTYYGVNGEKYIEAYPEAKV